MVPEAVLCRGPDCLSDEEAVALLIAALTAWSAWPHVAVDDCRCQRSSKMAWFRRCSAEGAESGCCLRRPSWLLSRGRWPGCRAGGARVDRLGQLRVVALPAALARMATTGTGAAAGPAALSPSPGRPAPTPLLEPFDRLSTLKHLAQTAPALPAASDPRAARRFARTTWASSRRPPASRATAAGGRRSTSTSEAGAPSPAPSPASPGRLGTPTRRPAAPNGFTWIARFNSNRCSRSPFPGPLAFPRGSEPPRPSPRPGPNCHFGVREGGSA